MPEGLRIEGYAIVSADGMIADRDRHMPDDLKIDTDVRFFNAGLDSAALIVHGRHSHEQQTGSDRRRRLILTDRGKGIVDHPNLPNAKLWNPVDIRFEDACKAMGIATGRVAVTGGTGVFGLFLDIGFDAFHLSRAGKVQLPGGRPVFPQVPACAPEEVLAQHGLTPGPTRVLDAEADATLVTWVARQTRGSRF